MENLILILANILNVISLILSLVAIILTKRNIRSINETIEEYEELIEKQDKEIENSNSYKTILEEKNGKLQSFKYEVENIINGLRTPKEKEELIKELVHNYQLNN